MKLFKYLFIINLLTLGLTSCSNSEEKAESHEEHGEHGESIVKWSKNIELFVEFGTLKVGEATDLIVHLTDVKTGKPLEKVKLTVSSPNGKTVTINKAKRKGIYIPSFTPSKAGKTTLSFKIENEEFNEVIKIKNLFVSDEQTHAKPHEHAENPNAITFLKEQAWNTNFKTEKVRQDTIYEVLKVSGEILPAQGDEYIITASANGILLFENLNTNIGLEIQKGQRLFTISGGALAENNVETEFNKAKANYEKAKSNFERKAKLFELNSISKTEWEKAKMEFDIAKSQYSNLAKNYSKNGKSISSPSKGFIKNLLVKQGEYVQTGQAIAIVSQNKKLRIMAKVSQQDFHHLTPDLKANIGVQSKVYSLSELNGQMLSFGKSVSATTPLIPVYFEIDNIHDFLPGSYVEIWLQTNTKSKAIVVPVSSILEEYGQYAVVVQKGGETFLIQNVEPGVSDGKNVEIISGLKGRERIVIQGAFQVKMASLSGTVPVHSH